MIGQMIGLYPGSFDPVTRGHLDIIRRALAFCPQLVIAVGSNVSKQNLFTPDERADMIRQTIRDEFTPAEQARLDVRQFTGATVHFAETIGAQLIVKGMRSIADYGDEEKMTIVNHRLAPGIDTVFLLTRNDLRDVSSTAVREMARIGVGTAALDHYLTPMVRDALLARLG